MNCELCGKLPATAMIRNPEFSRGLEVCGDCLNDYAREDFDALTKKMNDRLERERKP